MVYVIFAVVAFFSCVIQCTTGFGSAIVAMAFLPSFLPMTSCMAVSNCMTLPLIITMAYQYRKSVDYKKVILPCSVYIIACALTLSKLGSFDLSVLQLGLGIFLIILAIYSVFFAKKLKLRATFLTTVVCSAVSGTTSALFGIGGPLMALYYASTIDDKETYLGTLSTYFMLNQVYVIYGRWANGYLTADLIPYIAVSVVGVLLGIVVGTKIVNRINITTVRYGVYAVMVVSGITTSISALSSMGVL